MFGIFFHLAFLFCAFIARSEAFPIGVNLSPLGNGVRNVNYEPVSSYVFLNIFKHCSQLYYKTTANNGVSWNYGNPASIKLLRTGYPASLPYTNKNNYWAAMCDIGVGGNSLKNGTYAVTWTGNGDIGFSAASATVTSYAKNKATIQVHAPPTIGLNVRILRSNATSPVGNVNIVPIAFAANHSSLIFQPEFLELVRKYDHIRFTGWQKLTNTNPRYWSQRTLPTSISQHSFEGVAVEHMVDLIRLSGVSSAWFSFPLQSANYTNSFLQLLAKSLPTNRPLPLKLYIEAGCPEVYGDTDRHVESATLFSAAQSIFASVPSVQIVPTASVANIAYVSYLIMWYGTGITTLKAIGVPAQFGRSAQVWDHYNSYGQWDLSYSNASLPQIVDEVRRSSFVAEQMLNHMRNYFFSKVNDFEFVAWTGGSYFTAGSYGYRSGLQTVQGCLTSNKYPCVWANTKYNFQNASQITAAMPQIIANASKEQTVEDLLIAAQRSAALYDIYLDFLRRWEAVGGGLFIGNLLVKPAVRCLAGASGCGSEGLFEDPLQFTACTNTRGGGVPCQKVAPLFDYAAGYRSKLPYTAADIVLPPAAPCVPACKWGTCSQGSCVCFAGYTGPDCGTLSPSPNRWNQCNNNTGVNLNGINDWSTEWPFVDIFLHSRAWISQDFTASAWSTGTAQNLLKNGYPNSLLKNQKLGAMMVRDVRGHMRSGTFVCLYDGDGIISFSMDILAVKRDVPGRIEVTFKPSTGLNNGIFLIIERTNPQDPIRNIRLIMPGYETKYKAFPFHPLFLDKLKMYQTLRFMDWQNTNGVRLSQWADRSKIGVNTRSFAGSAEINGVMGGGGGFGVSIEYMVLLSNTLGTNAWFNMPHLATDEYVRNFATMVNATLRPDVKVYIEYSNEVWGTLFDGGKYAQTRGMNMSLANNAAQARFCFNLLRSNQIFQIWKDVFGAVQTAKRLEFVLGSQSVNPDVSRQLLATCTTVKIPQLQTALAIAPYFGKYTANVDKNLQIFLNTTLPAQINSLAKEVSGHNTVAKQYKLKLITYESGQGMAGTGNTYDLSIQANRNPAMTDLYQLYYSVLQQNGVQLMMAFTSTAIHDYNQCWGTIEASDQDPTTAPKYMGVMKYIDNHKTCPSNVYSQLKAQVRPYSCQNDCFGGGVCVADDQCECYYGYTGKWCEVGTYTEHVDLCGYKCTFNQGTCVPTKVIGTDRYWGCKCNENYYGPQCSLFSCPNNCTYNGQCLDANMCRCYQGFKGTSCEVDCGCKGHGICNPNQGSTATCLCDVGWTWSDSSKSCVPACNANANIFDLYHDPSSVVAGESACVAPGQPKCSTDCQFGTCVEGECRCWAGYTGTDCSVFKTAAMPNANSLVGMNLGGIAYYSPELVFVDVFKTSSDWMSVWADGWTLENTYAWGNGQTINLLPNGYPAYLLPGQFLVKLMLRDIHKHAPSGRYVCLYDGDGEIDFGMDSKVAAISKGRIEFDFNPTQVVGCTASYCSDNGIYLRLKKTNPQNPIHNIRVIMPGFENTYLQQPFYPYFLESIQHYKVIRFKDWQHTDSSPVVTWSDRATLDYVTQTKGVAIEHLIQLANQMGVDPWFCIPHQANDDYIRQFAIMVKGNLRPDVTVFLEYSNEVWNTLFGQGSWARAEGLRLNLAADGVTAGYRFHAQRSSQIFAIWKSVFADASIPSFASSSSTLKLVRVMSTFSISAYASNTILSWMKQVGGEADALGITGYFDCGGVGNANKVASTALMSVDQLLTTCINDAPNVLNYMKQQATIAKQYNLTIQTYEAGQALVEYNVMAYGNGETPGLTNLFIRANRDARMTDVYKVYLDAFIANGMMGVKNPLMSFSSCGNPTKYGSWGHIEYTGQKIETAPKYMALRQYFTHDNLLPALVPIAQDTGCFVCVDGCADRGGLSLNIDYFHQSGVKSPRHGSVWIAGFGQTITWPVPPDGNYIAQNVTIWLWKKAYCGVNGVASGAYGGELVTAIVPSNAPIPFSQGSYSFVLPKTLKVDGTATYFLEFRSADSDSTGSTAGSFYGMFSEVFTVQAGRTLLNQDCGSCNFYAANSYKQCLNQGSAWENSLTSINQNCLSEYNGFPLKLSSCYSTATQCKNIRTASQGKPITDCVATLSAYPSLALQQQQNVNVTAALTRQSVWDYNLWVNYMGYNEVTWTATRCSEFFTMEFAMACMGRLTRPPTVRPTALPTVTPTVSPTTSAPSVTPTAMPTAPPTRRPSVTPTVRPTRSPTVSPSRRPSNAPTTRPSTISPTVRPSATPSVTPTRPPTASPTVRPTRSPTASPTYTPSAEPTERPSRKPTRAPFPATDRPTRSPTVERTARPSAVPSFKPTAKPRPTQRPTQRPTL